MTWWHCLLMALRRYFLALGHVPSDGFMLVEKMYHITAFLSSITAISIRSTTVDRKVVTDSDGGVQDTVVLDD